MFKTSIWGKILCLRNKEIYILACLMLWSEESVRVEIETQQWPLWSRKESILNCLLIERSPTYSGWLIKIVLTVVIHWYWWWLIREWSIRYERDAEMRMWHRTRNAMLNLSSLFWQSLVVYSLSYFFTRGKSQGGVRVTCQNSIPEAWVWLTSGNPNRVNDHKQCASIINTGLQGLICEFKKDFYIVYT